MEKKSVSVIVPVYNVDELFFLQCLDSLKNQTYENYEVIIVSDGAKENIIKLCNIYCGKSDKFKLIEQDNAGVSVARNKGLEIASGEWIMFVDADDWIENSAIEMYINNAKENDDIVISNYYASYGENIYEQRFFNNNEEFFLKNSNKESILDLIIPLNNRDLIMDHGVPWGKIYNKEYVIKNKIEFPNGMVRFQDNIFNLYCFYHAENITYFDNCLYYYRIHDSSVTKKSNNYKIEYSRRLLSETCDFCNKHMNTREAKLRINLKIFYSINSYIKLSFLNEKNINYCSLKKEIKENLECYWYKDISILDYLSLKNRVVYFIVKLNMYRLVKMLLYASLCFNKTK